MDLQQGIPDTQSSPLEVKVITTAPPLRELKFFSDIHNSFWGNFELTPDILRERIDSGNLIVAAYSNGLPLGFVQTVLREEDESDLQQPPGGYPNQAYVWNTAQVSAKLDTPRKSAYKLLTNEGRFSRIPDYGNVLWFLDINVNKEFWSFGIGSSLIDFILKGYVNNEIPQFRYVRYGPTFTPDDRTINFHLRKGAFDTNYVIKNARAGHKVQDVRPACYIAPDFTLNQSY